MTEEDIMTNEIGDYAPDPSLAPAAEAEAAPEAPPAPEQAPEPSAPADPVEVITVEDLLDRLTGTDQGEAEEPPPEGGEEPPPEGGSDGLGGTVTFDGGPIEVIGMDTVLKRLETIQGAVDHPAMTTPFEEYTVTEALLLLLFLSAFIAACVKMLKGGFAWLR